jgi:hypothetical protein
MQTAPAAAATPTPTPVATSTPATAPIATPPTTTPSPPPPPTPKCYIVCTCGDPDCHLKQDRLQQRKRSSATLCAPYIKRKCD